MTLVPFAELSDARIHYEIAGPANAPIIVFSNSLGAILSMWDLQAAAFSDRFRVLRYDTRGHGQSSTIPGPYSIKQLARDVLALLDLLKLDRIHFCGLSMGGQIGQWLGLNAPSRIGKLILSNTAAKIGNAAAWNARIETVTAKGMKEVSSGVVGRWFTPAFREKHPEVVSPILLAFESANPAGYVSSCAAVRDFDTRATASQIRIPTLVMSGAHDLATPPADGRALAAQIPGAHFVELNAAHLSNIEAATRFNLELANFLSS
jgi:3-oxoadipate enol-lactonase